jgi:hypothetical protein
MTKSSSPSSFLLAFPEDQGSSEYPAKITFEQIHIPPLDATSFLKAANTIVTDPETGEPIQFDSRTQGANELNGLDQTSEIARGATDRAAIDTTAGFAAQTVRRTPRAGNTATNPDTPKIQLYLPPGINFRDGISYSDTTNLGAIGASIEKSLQSGEGIARAAFNAFVTDSKGLIDGLRTGVGGDAGSLAALKVANKFSKFERANAALSSATRVALNPNTRTLFQSVPVRSFAFQFKMIPNSASEVKTIEAIIKRFRTVMYPEEIGTDAISLGYKFPDPFEIKMFYNNSEVFTKILPSYLRDINVTYNTSGMGFHEDGGFTDCDVSLTFTESRPLSKDDVARGGY